MMNKTLKGAIFYLYILVIPPMLLVSAEGLLRLAFPDKAVPYRSLDYIAYEHDPSYIVRLKPNSRNTFERSPANGGETIEWRANADRFRGEDLSGSARARIIIYGDSNIQAIFSRYENTYPMRLKKYLEEIYGYEVEVLNAGIIGSGPDQYLIRMEQDFDKYAPDIVIFDFFADNDFGDLIRNRLFRLGDSGELETVQGAATPDVELRLGTRLKKFGSSLLIVRAVKRLLSGIGEALSVGGPRTSLDPKDVVEELIELSEKEFDVYRKNLPRKYSHFGDHYDIDIAIAPELESSRTKVALSGKILERANKYLNERGVPLIVLIQPSSSDLTDNYVVNHDVLSSYSQYDRRRLTSTVEMICVENGILHINLFDEFVRNGPSNLYFREEDNHWNDEGQDLVARITADFIRDGGLLKDTQP